MSSPEGTGDPVEQPEGELPPQTPVVEEEPVEEPNEDDPAAAKIAKANREAKNLRERVKALEAIEKKYNEAEAAKLSELDKAKKALEAKDQELATIRISNFRRDAALSAGLTADDIEFITGTTEEECAEQAKKLAKRLALTKPATDLRQGNRGQTPAAPVDGNALIRQMAGYT